MRAPPLGGPGSKCPRGGRSLSVKARRASLFAPRAGPSLAAKDGIGLQALAQKRALGSHLEVLLSCVSISLRVKSTLQKRPFWTMCLGPMLEPSVLAGSGDGVPPCLRGQPGTAWRVPVLLSQQTSSLIILPACLQDKSEGEKHTLGKTFYLVSSEQH